METGTNGLQRIDGDECLRLLAVASLGRIALTDRALPVILPVSYGVLGTDLVFEVDSGLLLRAAHQHHIVCFEVDFADIATSVAWSVIVTGSLRVVDDADLIERARRLGIRTWSTGTAGQILTLPTAVVSGRRAVAADSGRAIGPDRTGPMAPIRLTSASDRSDVRSADSVS